MRSALGFLDFRRRGAVGDADEDVRQPEFALVCRLLFELNINFGLGDVYLPVLDALLHALDDELLSHGFPE